MAIRAWQCIGLLLSVFAFRLGSAGCGGAGKEWTPSAEQLTRAEKLARFAVYMEFSRDEKPAEFLRVLEADGFEKAVELVPADFSVGEKRIGAYRVRIQPGAASKDGKRLTVWFCDPEQIPDWQTRKDLVQAVPPWLTRPITVGSDGKMSLSVF